ASGHKTERGTSVTHGIAKAHNLADGDIGSILTWRSQDGERGRLSDIGNEDSFPFVRNRLDGVHILDRAEKVGLLDDDCRGSRVHCLVKVFKGSNAITRWHFFDAEPASVSVSMQYVAVLWINTLRDDPFSAPAGTNRQEYGFDERGSAIVERGIGNIQSRNLADHGLKLVDCL